jgi:hypothetical protein
VVKEATAENHIEDAILCEIADIVTQEGQIGQIGSRFDSLTILEIALPNLDAQRIEASARQFDGIPTLEAPKIDNPFPGGALGKKYLQKSLGELKQREVFHLVGLLRLRERPVVKPDVVCREAASHDSHLPHLTTYHFISSPPSDGVARDSRPPQGNAFRRISVTSRRRPMLREVVTRHGAK